MILYYSLLIPFTFGYVGICFDLFLYYLILIFYSAQKNGNSWQLLIPEIDHPMKIMEELRKFKSSLLLGRYPSCLITFIKAQLFCLFMFQLRVNTQFSCTESDLYGKKKLKTKPRGSRKMCTNGAKYTILSFQGGTLYFLILKWH